VALILAASPGPSGADSWAGPQVLTVFSEDGQRFARIVPGESVGDTVGFAGARKGAYARAELYQRRADRAYGLIAEATLRNPVAPVAAILSNAGRLVTFDNWHNAGYGAVIVVYAPDGALVAAHELEKLYPPERLGRLMRSVSSRWWRCAAHGYVDPDRQTQVYVTERLGGTFVVDLATGAVDYRAGAATCR